MNNEDYRRYKALVENHLMDFLPEMDPVSYTLMDSMKYSLSAGGKRIRPTLLLGACEFCGGNITHALPYACAMEYIHTYSLIHDDLPAMDNDDMRRGLKTNHIVYGDAMAILAGDGLQSAAFQAMNKDMFLYFDDVKELKKRVRAAYEISKGSGCSGMVAGQVADIEAEGKECSKEMLDFIHLNKTGALIISSVKAGTYLGNPDEDMVNRLTDYAENLGLAFQIYDDILDIEGQEEIMGKKKGMDSIKQKATYPALYGMDQSRKKMKDLTEAALEVIAPYYDNAEFFAQMVKYLAERKK